MALIILVRRLSEQPGLGQHQKGVNYHFSSPQLDEPYVIWKLLISEAYICSFSRIGQKRKNYSLFNFLPENRKISLDWALSCASRGIDNFFLEPCSESRALLESCRLAELKYAFFSRTGRKTEKLQHSKHFPSPVFRHGRLQGSTILF